MTGFAGFITNDTVYCAMDSRVSIGGIPKSTASKIEIFTNLNGVTCGLGQTMDIIKWNNIIHNLELKPTSNFYELEHTLVNDNGVSTSFFAYMKSKVDTFHVYHLGFDTRGSTILYEYDSKKNQVKIHNPLKLVSNPIGVGFSITNQITRTIAEQKLYETLRHQAVFFRENFGNESIGDDCVFCELTAFGSSIYIHQTPL